MSFGVLPQKISAFGQIYTNKASLGDLIPLVVAPQRVPYILAVAKVAKVAEYILACSGEKVEIGTYDMVCPNSAAYVAYWCVYGYALQFEVLDTRTIRYFFFNAAWYAYRTIPRTPKRAHGTPFMRTVRIQPNGTHSLQT